jgi:hypothetical protein
MQVQNDECHMRLRSELQRIIDALDAQRLFQAAAYASMAVDCLDRVRPPHDAIQPAG